MADLMISGFLPGQQGRLAAALAATGGYPPGTAGTSSRADGIGLIFSIHGGVIGGLGEAYALAGAHGTAAGARLLGPIYAFGGGVVSQWGRDSGAGYATSERVIRAGVAGATVAGASYLGAAGGAALGMAVGGPVGAAIGGMVGGAIGGWAGGVVAPYAADAASLVLDGAGAAARAAEEAYDSARGSLSDAASALNPFD